MASNVIHMISSGIVAANNMRLFTYVVARDYGFAPNPFYGICTLATCKPVIRKTAAVGDWIVGVGSKKYSRSGFLVYAMQVSEVITFNQYWNRGRFCRKRTNLRGSMKQAYGDNIYYKDGTGQWHQQDSHHSYSDGSLNPHNTRHDTKVDRVLIGENYMYWGGSGPKIPRRFRNYGGYDVCALRNHRCKFPKKLIVDFVEWLQSLDGSGRLGEPLNWEMRV